MRVVAITRRSKAGALCQTFLLFALSFWFFAVLLSVRTSPLFSELKSVDPFRTAVPFSGQTTQSSSKNLSGVSPKRGCVSFFTIKTVNIYIRPLAYPEGDRKASPEHTL